MTLVFALIAGGFVSGLTAGLWFGVCYIGTLAEDQRERRYQDLVAVLTTERIKKPKIYNERLHPVTPVIYQHSTPHKE